VQTHILAGQRRMDRLKEDTSRRRAGVVVHFGAHFKRDTQPRHTREHSQRIHISRAFLWE
jgi:hypothetical protein